MLCMPASPNDKYNLVVPDNVIFGSLQQVYSCGGQQAQDNTRSIKLHGHVFAFIETELHFAMI